MTVQTVHRCACGEDDLAQFDLRTDPSKGYLKRCRPCIAGTNTHRICGDCGERKPVDEFHRHRTQGRQGVCKPCGKVKFDAWKQRNPERWRGHIIKAKGYDITPERYLELLEEQDHRCKLCRRTAAEAMGEGYRWLAVDHCHTTGRVRGLLCNPCNTVLGMAQDDPARLRAAASYLEEN